MSLDYQPAVGDLVIVHDPRLAQQLDKQGALGVVVRLRRAGARTLFLPRGDAHWIECHRLHPHPEPARVGPPVLLAIGEALRALQPEEAELAAPDESDEARTGAPQVGGADNASVVRLEVLCRGVTAADVARLQRHLGGRLVSWEVRPYGMAFVTVLLALRGQEP